jgi:hypothetical protein
MGYQHPDGHLYVLVGPAVRVQVRFAALLFPFRMQVGEEFRVAMTTRVHRLSAVVDGRRARHHILVT